MTGFLLGEDAAGRTRIDASVSTSSATGAKGYSGSAGASVFKKLGVKRK